MKAANFKILTLALGLTGSLFSQQAEAQHAGSAVQQQACACFEVNVVGQGPAVILIPGVASSGEVWQSTVDTLKADYQLHVLTLAGFAGVKPIPMQSWGDGYLAIQQHAILRYISEQQLEKPVIVGHSLGGYLALALAANAPEQIGGAVNVDGLPALGAMFSQAAASNNTGQQQPRRFDPMAMAKSMATAEDWQQRIVSNMMSSDGQTSGRVMGELMQADLRGQLTNIRVPVLTLGALQHGAPYSTPEQVQQNYENQLANAPAQYHSFAFARDSKHFIMADAPEWLNQQIGRFLSQRGKE
ncbi:MULTISPECIES: alpha/beta fold hydrolase [unclassified Arsukibacterium]|uniref:alpha/beta fold hydrolase n=1 Tax=unclassified Arsukibacterium TaxID=2635278 RepID=UPI000C3CEDD8|nr:MULTISPECIES: alpha/beta hydrolase [unclassified Arsukibacterium]MAA94677.1 alpha/beta hydrolase [Rheinheimera sp.]MBM32739.1 alpha/beta hydrolase [Rheinheimera sp.]|tara:strand:+ start:80859 stop:81758 length:900 start_codon:yes stop_codon:yes gene_type:complete